MNFNLTSPCQECPFRVDTFKGWLGPGAARIAADITEKDLTFACHKTVAELGSTAKEESQCAGALLMLQQAGQLNGNWRFRMAQQLQLLDVSKLKDTVPVFRSSAAFVAHHAGRE
jgi:hypothetical protein